MTTAIKPRPARKINWECSKKETAQLHRIAKRAIEKLQSMRDPSWKKVDLIDLNMDIAACHLNGNPLDLDKLENADDFNFIHDVCGIHNHIDRTNGTLKDCFLPRCSR